MLFNTLSFLVFFLAFFSVFYLVARTRNQRRWLLIIGSCLFYSFWNWHYLPLLLGTGLLDFYLARKIAETEDRRRATRLLTVSICANLGVLTIFKYSQFFVDNIVAGLGLLGYEVHHPTLSIVLPIGISFYTFQSISYTVDVYRGGLEARKQPLDFIGALTFFPHLVAGPIVRSSFIIPQFERFVAAKWEACQRAFLLISFGLFKKTMADLLGETVARVFNATGPVSAIDSWTGALAFAGQIYGDFSAYTDIARGLALLLGFELPLNFDLPYLARSPADFWRRWHISLSTWLRDYLYIPLGGNRGAAWRTNVNLMLTMLLGGLWHGASWTFVAWGAYHGLLLVGTHLLAATKLVLPAVVRIALTFYLVTIGWVLFRASSLTRAWEMIRGMHAPLIGSVTQSSVCVALAMVALSIVLFTALDYIVARTRTASRPYVLWPSVVIATAIAISVGPGANAFIYFQF